MESLKLREVGGLWIFWIWTGGRVSVLSLRADLRDAQKFQKNPPLLPFYIRAAKLENSEHLKIYTQIQPKILAKDLPPKDQCTHRQLRIRTSSPGPPVLGSRSPRVRRSTRPCHYSGGTSRVQSPSPYSCSPTVATLLDIPF